MRWFEKAILHPVQHKEGGASYFKREDILRVDYLYGELNRFGVGVKMLFAWLLLVMVYVAARVLNGELGVLLCSVQGPFFTIA